ncbi:MAG: DUF4173 domain-containing protein [Patescibacteria group bacterium]|nr:DUF4173 domain-containing protein [Patescibacteria group bacterium]
MTKEKTNLCLIIFFVLILGILVDYLFYQKSISISFFVFNSIAIIFALVLARRFDKKISGTQYFILISILLFSAGVFLRASSFLAFFNIVGSLYLLFFFLTLFLNKNISDFGFSKYIIYPLSFFLKSFPSASRFIRKYKNAIPENNKIVSKKLRSVVRGVIIAIPFLIIFILLLSSADQVFQAYANKFIKIDLDPAIILRVLKVLFVSYLFLGIFSRITKNEKLEEMKGSSQRLEPTSEKSRSAENKIKENKSSNFIESSTVLVLIELLFLAFIIIQFYYLFGGKDYVWGIEEYITYSEYAKKGFYELICVAIISFLLIFAIDEAGKRKTPKEKKIFKILGAVLVLEISVIIYSAFTRMTVYVDGYGLTFSRFLVFVFLLWIFFVFLNFLYKMLLEKRKELFFLSVFCLSIIFWVGINIINPDAFIARKNIARLVQGEELDSFYLSHLSADAIPETAKIFQMNIDEEIKIEVARSLYYRCNYILGASFSRVHMEYEPISFKEKLENAEEKQNENWQSFNISEKRALLALQENYQEIVKYQKKFFKKRLEECRERMRNCKDEKWQSCEKMCEIAEKEAKMEE